MVTVQRQHAQRPTVRQVRSEAGLSGKTLHLKERQRWQHTHPLRNLEREGEREGGYRFNMTELSATDTHYLHEICN